MSGWVGDLNETQTEALSQLRSLCTDAALTDADLLRFLRARQFDVTKANMLLVGAQSWHSSFVGEGITYESVKAEMELGKSWLRNRDRQNRPIQWIRVAKHFKGKMPMELTERACVYWMERAVKMLDAKTDSLCLVFDMTGFGLSNMDYSFVKFLIGTFEKYYPERLGKALLVNSPWLFWGCWKIISPWLDKRTSSKVHFVDTKQLDEHIDKDNLTKFLGGNDDWEFVFDASDTEGFAGPPRTAAAGAEAQTAPAASTSAVVEPVITEEGAKTIEIAEASGDAERATEPTVADAAGPGATSEDKKSTELAKEITEAEAVVAEAAVVQDEPAGAE